MRIVIDLQGAQSSGSWNRGIGRYSVALAKSIVQNRQNHEVLIVLSDAFPEAVERLRSIFYLDLPPSNIKVWSCPGSVAHNNRSNDWLRLATEHLREAFLESLRPDIVLVSSIFEGLVDDAVTSVGCFSKNMATAVVLYDLIPFIRQEPYLENEQVKSWYLEKLDYLKRADLLLSISGSSRREALEHLGTSEDACVNISTDADAQFEVVGVTESERDRIFLEYGIRRNFIMYTGGIDYRKNIEGLIRAYGKLDSVTRDEHQLVIVCSVNDETRRKLLELAKRCGIENGSIVFTGFVSEADLIFLYNLCFLFVFPSLHEGFGLPLLEAMRCGAPVIAANASSLPEVLGLDEALFDPDSDLEIAKALKRALTDTAFRDRLISHCKKQASRFSWDYTARSAIVAMEDLVDKRKQEIASQSVVMQPKPKPKLAYISPLPPERSGISDYSAELIPVLSEYYDIDVVVAQDQVSDNWLTENCHVRSVSWFLDNFGDFDRVLYHFGNSAFHKHMFDLLNRAPGVVVLHDFYLSSLVHHLDVSGQIPGFFNEHLYASHGYKALLDYFEDGENAVWKYPTNREVLEQATGVIVHSSSTVDLVRSCEGKNQLRVEVVPLLRTSAQKGQRLFAREALGFGEDDFIVCSFGMVGPTKLSLELLLAWSNSKLANKQQCHLVFVGENQASDYGSDFSKTLRRMSASSQVKITGWVTQSTFRQYLMAADVGVQLRTLSRGETSASVLDCMNYGLATIVNANGSMKDLENGSVLMLDEEFQDADLVQALDEIFEDASLRHRIAERGQSVVYRKHNPTVCAGKYHDAIEGFYAKEAGNTSSLVKSVASIAGLRASVTEMISFSDSVSVSFPIRRLSNQLLVDVSELVNGDARTGIQRVVRSILKRWLLESPEYWRIEPVYAVAGDVYRYARKFTAKFMGVSSNGLCDEPIEYSCGDIFFGLDMQPHVQSSESGFYQKLRSHGVPVYFMVYDMLCIHQRKYFEATDADAFSKWLNMVGETDGAICISRSVAKELSLWVEQNDWKRKLPFRIDYSHLGADVEDSLPTKGIPADGLVALNAAKSRTTFLMVGTLEPRKGHEQVINAFDQLWRRGVDINLVIVGKLGWLMSSIADQILQHSELNKRLFWLQGASDEFLVRAYEASDCLVAASRGEGFGLPLIEAAQNGLSILARDIPVFREVAGDHAYYFLHDDAETLASSIQDWLSLYEKGDHPASDDMPWLTWEQSAQNLLNLIIPDNTSGKETKKEAL